MIVVGGDDYQYRLSRLAYSFRGALSMDYIQTQGFKRINQLTEHANKMADELKHGE